MVIRTKQRPSLMEVRQQHHLSSRELAVAAGVPLRIEYLMEIGGRVSREHATQILGALSEMVGRRYDLHNVEICVADHS